jgi:RHH-type proline utilization regulon transcriptional repressor/proline dehydrogenase/delta 1-pyrroline-5-carboxylate dehydrogenase
LGESNIFRYRPVKGVLIRAEKAEELLPALQAVLAGRTCHVPVQLTVSEALAGLKELDQVEGLRVFVENEAQFVERIHTSYNDRVRLFSAPSTAVRQAAIERHVALIDEPMVSNGRLELRYYLREQAISETTHRYGNIVTKPK